MKFGRANASPPGIRRDERFAEQNLDAGGIHFPRADKMDGVPNRRTGLGARSLYPAELQAHMRRQLTVRYRIIVTQLSVPVNGGGGK